MTAQITVFKVSEQDAAAFLVEVRGAGPATTHAVTVPPEMLDRLRWHGSATDLVRESFVFLLEREPPSSILRTFDLEVIGKYFPEYPSEIVKRQ